MKLLKNEADALIAQSRARIFVEQIQILPIDKTAAVRRHIQSSQQAEQS